MEPARTGIISYRPRCFESVLAGSHSSAQRPVEPPPPNPKHSTHPPHPYAASSLFIQGVFSSFSLFKPRSDIDPFITGLAGVDVNEVTPSDDCSHCLLRTSRAIKFHYCFIMGVIYQCLMVSLLVSTACKEVELLMKLEHHL